jgi:hypothetical protein
MTTSEIRDLIQRCPVDQYTTRIVEILEHLTLKVADLEERVEMLRHNNAKGDHAPAIIKLSPLSRS